MAYVAINYPRDFAQIAAISLDKDGKVSKVKAGDKVSVGDTLAVLEAMKMENDIQSS